MNIDPDKNIDQTGTAGIFARAKESFIWILSSSVIFQIVNWAITILVMRILSPEDYGMMGILMIAIEYLAPLGHFYIGNWFVWKETVTRVEEATVSQSIIYLSLGVTICSFLLAPVYVSFFNASELVWSARIISLMFVISSISMISEIKFRRELNFKAISILNVIVRLFRGGVTVSFALLGFGYYSLLYGYVIARVLRALCLLYMRPPIVWKEKFDCKIFRTAFRFGLNSTIGLFFWMIYSSSDNVVIGRFFGTEILGYYSVAFFLIDLPLSKLNEMIRPLLLPYFSRLAKNRELLDTIFLRFYFLYMAILVPIFIGLILLADEFVIIVLGEQWHGSVKFLQILAFVGILRTVTDLMSPYFVGIGKPEINKICNLLGVVLLPVSFIIAATLYGIDGILYVWLLVYPIVPFANAFFFTKESSVSFIKLCRATFPVVVSAVLMVLILMLSNLFLQDRDVVTLIAKVFLGAIIYCVTAWGFFRKEYLSAIKIFRN